MLLKYEEYNHAPSRRKDKGPSTVSSPPAANRPPMTLPNTAKTTQLNTATGAQPDPTVSVHPAAAAFSSL